MLAYDKSRYHINDTDLIYHNAKLQEDNFCLSRAIFRSCLYGTSTCKLGERFLLSVAFSAC